MQLQNVNMTEPNFNINFGRFVTTTVTEKKDIMDGRNVSNTNCAKG